jgi:hypothetical protein
MLDFSSSLNHFFLVHWIYIQRSRPPPVVTCLFGPATASCVRGGRSQPHLFPIRILPTRLVSRRGGGPDGVVSKRWAVIPAGRRSRQTVSRRRGGSCGGRWAGGGEGVRECGARRFCPAHRGGVRWQAIFFSSANSNPPWQLQRWCRSGTTFYKGSYICLEIHLVGFMEVNPLPPPLPIFVFNQSDNLNP